MELYNSLRDTHFNSLVDDRGVSHFCIPINNEDKYQYDILINNKDNRLIPPMARSRRRIKINPLVSLVSVLPSNLIAPNLVRSCNSDDICVVCCSLRRMS